MHQTTQAWLSLPASKLRPVQRIQPVSASWTTLPRGSGLSCSSSSANRTAKKLMRADDTDPCGRSSREETIEVAQHRRGRTPDEEAARPALRVDPLVWHRQE